MSGDLVFLLVFLLIVASFVHGDFAITVAYLFVGIFFVGRLWVQQTSKSLHCERRLEPHAFWGEEIPVRLAIKNPSILPIPWLRLYESLPVNLTAGESITRVVSLGPREQVDIEYTLRARKRGYYPIGPLFTSQGDMFGLIDAQESEAAPSYLTVYPRIIPLTKIKLPSRSPLGTLRHTQKIFEDPTRVLSKRDYVTGDSLRRVDWKSTATVGRLQVKQFEPSIALEVSLFLNLNATEYPAKSQVDATELAIVIAASLANWVVSQKQTVGLVTNGVSVANKKSMQPILPGKGRAHLMRILETLAQVQKQENIPLVEMLQKHGPSLSWGTTLVVITGGADELVFDEIFRAQRRGQSVVLIISGRTANVREMKQRAEYFNLPFHAFQDEDDLTLWRQ